MAARPHRAMGAPAVKAVAARRAASMKAARTRRRVERARRRPIERLSTYRGTLAARHAATLLALIEVHRRHGRATLRMVQLAAGHGSLRTTHDHLHALAELGLVGGVGVQGGLHPLVSTHDPIHNQEATA